MSSVAAGATVLLYVAEADEREVLRTRLQGHGAHVEEIATANEIGRLMDLHPGAIGFVEVVTGDGGGLAIIRRIRSVDASIDIVALSSDNEMACRVDARAAGATDYLSMPVREIDLEMRLARLSSQGSGGIDISFDDVTPHPETIPGADIQALETALAQTREALNNALHSAPVAVPSISGEGRSSDVDELTGLSGSGPLQDYLDREYARAKRYGHALSVLLIDVDKMARYCKSHGEAAGDSALVLIADVLRSALRSPDIVTRPGSDSFVILATDTTEDQALVLGNRLREALAKESQHASRPAVTISIGIASAQRLSVGRASDLLAAAERAMAEAKGAGRDRCRIALEV